MAEDLQIRIPVKLGTENVLSEIDGIKKTIAQDSKYHLNVIAKISDNSIAVIQGQLSALASKKYEVNIGASVSNIQGQMSQVQNQIKTSIQAVNQQAIVKPNIEIDKKAIDNMVNTFNSYFDISYKRGNQSSKAIKNNLYDMMTDLYKAAQLGDGNKINSINQQLADFANTYSKIRPNPDAVQTLKDYREEVLQWMGLGSSGKISFNNDIYKGIVAEVGDFKSAKKMLDSALGVGKWSTHGNSGDELPGYFAQMGGALGKLADINNPSARIVEICQKIIELRENINSTSSSVTEMMSAFDFANGLNDVLKASGVKNQAIEVQQLTSAFKNANGEIQITKDLFNQFTLNGTNTSSLDSLLGKIGINNYKVVENDVQNAISSFEQFKQVYNDVALVQQKYQQTAQQTAQSTQNITQVNQQAVNSINKISTGLNNAVQSSSAFRSSFDRFPNDISIASDAVDYLIQKYSKFGEVSTTTNKGEPLAGLPEYFRNINIQVKSATGELQNFYYGIKNIGDDKNPILVYSLKNIQEADAGIKKLQADIEKTKSSYQAKLANFESTNKGLTSGLQTEIQAVQTAINNLSTYDGIKNVEISFNNLVASSKEITANIKAVGSSLNPIDNAENVISKMPVDIQKLANGFSALKKQPEDADNIIKQLQNDLQKVIELENQGGKNKEWSEAYKALQQDLRNSTNYLKLLQETEKSSTGANSLVNNVKSYQMLLQQTASEWKDQGLYIGEVKKQMSSMLSHIGQIKNEAKLQEYVDNFNKLSTNVLRVKSNLDSQVESQDKIYQLQTQIAKLGVNDVSNKALLTDQLNIEQQKLNNLQMQGVTLKNIVSLEEQEKYVTEATSNARNQMVMAQNHANDKTLADNIKQVKDYETAINKAITALNNLKNNGSFSKNANNSNVQTQIAEINALISQLSAFGQTVRGALSSGTVDATQFANLSAEMSTLQSKFDSTSSSVKAFQTELRQTNGQQAQEQKNKVLIAQLEAYAVANSKAMKSNQTLKSGLTPSQEINNMLTALKAGADSSDWSKIQSNFRIVRSEIKALGLEGGTIFQNLWAQVKKFSRWMGITGSISRLVMKVRQAITEIKDLDSILTEISKTSDRTAESLEKLGDSAFEAASKYGRTASDYLTGVQEMSRAGFGEQASEQMAELSLLVQSAGDMEADLANKYLIAMDAAYKYEGNVQTLNDTLDRQNYITNRNAVNMEELTNATKVAGSQAAQSGVDIDEMTAAVGTMIATTQEGGETAGRAFKAILMNLRQVSAEADDIGDGGESITTESLTKYEKACEALGVSLKTVKDGVVSLRDPMEILGELATAVQGEAEDSVKVANLINSVGGKHRGNQLISLLRNWDTYKKMLSEFNSEDAIGSALEEANKSANNLQGRLNALSNSFTELVNNFADSDTLKSFVNTLNGILTTVNGLIKNFGTLQTIIPMVFAGLSLKNVGEQNKHARFCTATHNKYRECNTFKNKVVKLLGNAKALQPLIA